MVLIKVFFNSKISNYNIFFVNYTEFFRFSWIFLRLR